jgi:hypothetical protein
MFNKKFNKEYFGDKTHQLVVGEKKVSESKIIMWSTPLYTRSITCFRVEN